MGPNSSGVLGVVFLTNLQPFSSNDATCKLARTWLIDFWPIHEIMLTGR